MPSRPAATATTWPKPRPAGSVATCRHSDGPRAQVFPAGQNRGATGCVTGSVVPSKELRVVKYAVAYLAALVIFLAMDFVWLGYVARNFYWSRMDSLLLDQPRMGVAAVFYLVWVAGLVWFALVPAMGTGLLSTALVNGALFGLFTYLTYNGTNLAVLKGYDPVIAVTDTSWGMVVGAVSSGLAFVIVRALGLLEAGN
ncbi:hypothetical protein CSC94_21185 [Zhengella mangrovi]|uniref:DUF2177 domain-containing protein n=1 Tax=Zhengella mangrovi TaxID=1982044 RepID=A0A2G1QHP6_9HYPH|nr:hypothetical protein CSC94_21185 [Zhengella mangrovi]